METIEIQWKLSDDIKGIIGIAQALAKESMNKYFGAPHLLKATLHKESGLRTILADIGQDIFYLEDWADVRIENCPKVFPIPNVIESSHANSDIFQEAEDLRLKFGLEEISPMLLLIALVTPGVAFSFEQLKTLPLQREILMDAYGKKVEIKSIVAHKTNSSNSQNQVKSNQALLKYCIDKSSMAKQGKLEPIVGRENEVRTISEIICRRSKPNVMLVGDPGVGKSALIDGFVLSLETGNTPALLKNSKVFELDLGSLVAGASYKGEIEERLKQILNEIKQYEKTILFIDEIHVLLDRQSNAAGSANFLKPELARGELTVIGATTPEEFRKFIEADEAFNRRFEMLKVEEPSKESCFHMVKAIIPRYEKHHGLTVPDECISESINLAKRYTKERKLPDVAIDLLDRSLASLRMINETGEISIQMALEEFSNRCQEEDEGLKYGLEDWKWYLEQMKQQVSPILWNKALPNQENGISNEVDSLKQKIQKNLEELKQAVSIPNSTLSIADLRALVSVKTGIPLGKLQSHEKDRLLNMEEKLKERVIGQDHAISSISDAVLESRAGLGKPGQPIGSFFFLGPTGTGKTELAKSMAEFLFQEESAMIRFDMSEFKEEHSAALLYGAPPGYVGYEEGGLLVNKIRQKPYSVVLFDEIEKAHASVFDIFLQILDEGKLHDKLGKEGDFSNALIIFTSNIGSQFVVQKFNDGDIPNTAELLDKMSGYFRPEFLGRLTEIVPFSPMKKEMVQKILKNQLKDIFTFLNKEGITLQISQEAFSRLAELGFNPVYGARPLAGIVRSEVRRPLSKMLIKGELKAGNTLDLNLGDEGDFQWAIK
ncbi:ATP-dependent Clp protease ATP-binding subunit ClpA [Aquiflexum balticum DSM 16537]|uniref:ATP-dependent Clp protease ATP-binding subunit ClpA n=1 Tax=Aquiflexum balticum DSM 16537 TaxID=758820 RepID=A0A1W2H5A4_9BACT|nr:ATP-dependent Clp protease ATP-binding subunit [Aquiflexum balticum]SMD44115.1 ATP-dependent Clp protease ATP-binding subunit ClpA [Aquiflexum balticum DSM 16537]